MGKWSDISQKKIQKWPSRWKYAQHHQSSGRCKSKYYLSTVRLSSKTKITSAGKDAEKGELSYTVGGNLS